MSSDNPGDELVDVLDENGAVIGSATRRQMRAERLAHRATYIAVVRGSELGGHEQSDDLVLAADTVVVVHQRADWKDIYPSYWDLAFGGVCGAGEPWLRSAQRELWEEAGINAPLIQMAEGEFRDTNSHTFGRLYLTATNAELRCNDGEVARVDEVALADLERWVQKRDVCPDTLQLVLPMLVALVRG